MCLQFLLKNTLAAASVYPRPNPLVGNRSPRPNPAKHMSGPI